jgi:signal transduction histidine kinase
MVSYPLTSFFDQVKTFPYLFLLIYIVGLLVFYLNRSSFRIRRRTLDFRGKIQLTLILSLLGISPLVGIGLIIYNYDQFKNSLREDLNDKLYSISSELSMRIGAQDELSPAIHDMLNDQLISLSDLTRTDINIYDLYGRLYATSRSEIYDRGLTSRRIDPIAYHALSIESKNNFIHKEYLGKMSFYSAYIPLYNKMNNLVGYLNLPYFARQDEFMKDVSNFIITFSNIYILLILISLIVAMLIGTKLTLPLLKIEQNLKGIQLGKVNAKIEYLGEDEIGRLAKEYNKKVDELAESAALLARTERELAWREMARQIAHEINNPLTPMKLNIQYLRRIKEQGNENFDEYFDQVSKTLIENIDVLSSIASSFSDFARMPRIHNELIDLRERVKEAARLYENTPEVSIDVVNYSDSPVWVFADKDQFNRALINLIKNGIQAIPKEKQGRLVLELKKEDQHALRTVSDNGSGIPEELRPKLFEPNFTTKSSGMGLGLAITRRIIENFKGEVWFRTSMDIGTTFFVRIPLADNTSIIK